MTNAAKQETPVATVEKKARKERSDKGLKRGPRKPKED